MPDAQPLLIHLSPDELAAWEAEAQRLAGVTRADPADAMDRMLRAVMKKHLAQPIRSRNHVAKHMPV